MRTSKIEIGTSVMVLPYHDPVGLAKYAATLDALSRGRLILGVGVGALREEFEALGIPMRQRGKLTDQAIEVMLDLWCEQLPSYHGGRFEFKDLHFSPKPVQQPHIPLWIGGSSEAAIARTARVAQGWHPSNIEPAQYAAGLETLQSLVQTSANPDRDMVNSIRIDLATDSDPDSASLANWQSRLKDYADAGVEHAVLALTSGNIDQLRRWMSALSEQLVGRL